MKEIRNANYVVRISPARLPDAVLAHTPDSYEILINQSVHVVVLPWLPRTGWPEPLPIDEEDVHDRDDAAWLAVGQAHIAVVPAQDGKAVIEVFHRTDVDGAINVIVWMDPHRHALLTRELARRVRAPVEGGQGRETRLTEVGSTELGRFLTEVLPNAVVYPLQREFLVLPDAPAPGRDPGSPDRDDLRARTR